MCFWFCLIVRVQRAYPQREKGKQTKSHEFQTLPVLPFLGFFRKMARKTAKKTWIFIPTEPLKSLDKKGKTLKKKGKPRKKEKKQGIPKNKKKKDRAFQGVFRQFQGSFWVSPFDPSKLRPCDLRLRLRTRGCTAEVLRESVLAFSCRDGLSVLP